MHPLKARRLGLLLLLSVATILLLWNTRETEREAESIYYNHTYKTCAKKTKVGFLKAHKCASSTVQNILLRFAYNNGLNVVLPTVGNYVGRYVKYNRLMISTTPWERANLSYDMFALHTIWNQAEVENTLGEGATYITIMRDPVDLFESLWNYANLEHYYKVDLETFAVSPKTGKLSQRAYKNLGRNQMLWDNGLPGRLMDNATAVANKIKEIEHNFDLVLIAERFDESIILMKELLCWDFRDVVSLKLNARQSSHKTSLSRQARQALEEYLEADYRMYNYFKKKLNKKLREYGQTRMETQVGILHKANSNIKKECSLKVVDNELLPEERQVWGSGMLGYKGTSEGSNECRYIAMSELSFISILRDIQTHRARLALGNLDLEPEPVSSINDELVERLRDLPPQSIDLKRLSKILSPQKIFKEHPGEAEYE